MKEPAVDLENIKKQAEEGFEAAKDKAEEAKEKAEGVVADIKDKLGK